MKIKKKRKREKEKKRKRKSVIVESVDEGINVELEGNYYEDLDKEVLNVLLGLTGNMTLKYYMFYRDVKHVHKFSCCFVKDYCSH
jgi:hypothetical protein